MNVQPIQTPQFINTLGLGGHFKLHYPRGPQRNFLITLNDEQLQALAIHCAVMNETNEKALIGMFDWGFYSLTRLTQNSFKVELNGP